MKSELLWIAVPGGTVANGVATLRALVVPRLQADSPAAIADFAMEDWPALLAAATLRVETAPDSQSAARPVRATTRIDASSDVWRAFFPAAATVSPPQQRSYASPVTNPTSQNAAKIVGNYSKSARAFADPTQDAGTVVREQYAQWKDEMPVDPPGDIAPEDWKTPDFHRIVSLLREHPAVLKHLGLIVEIDLPAAEIPRTAPGTSQLIRLQCSLVAPGPVEFAMITPWTRFEFDNVRFVPAPAEDSDLSRGMVDLTGATRTGQITPGAPSPKWSLVTFDVDGGVGRLRDAARLGGARPGTARDLSLPVLHSAGLTLLRHGRGDQLRLRSGNTRRDNSAPSLASRELTADDLVLGYRVDIQEQNQEWVPLCARNANYSIDGQPIGPEVQLEEGHVKANAAVIGADKVLRADEVVTRWYGWNLATPRPVFDKRGQRPSRAKPVVMPFDFRWEFQPAGLTAKLRFRKSYRMRMRVADMAGGGIAAGDLAGNDQASDLVVYRRHEAIPPPELAPPAGIFVQNGTEQTVDHAVLGPGGTVDCLVIRSDPADGVDFAQFGEVHPGYPANDGRLLLPPPTSMTLAEQHGFLDGSDATTWSWVKRAIAPPVASSDGSYSWLPDAAAIGIMAYVRPGLDSPAPNATASTAWGPAWPDFVARTLRLLPDEPGRPVIEWADGNTTSQRSLLVRLQPAQQAEIEISSFPDDDKTNEFEISEWLDNAGESLVVNGRHPMVTPARVLQVVHAVRRPLKVPGGPLEAARKPGETSTILNPARVSGDPASAAIDPILGIDPASTGQLDVSARWTEHRDITPPTETFEHVASLKVERAAKVLPELRHEFGDTRHRRIRYTLTALSRFRQFFEATPGDDAAFRTEATLAEISIPSSARPVPPVVLSAFPSFGWETTGSLADGGNSLVRKRLGGRVRVELARPWNLSGEDEQLAVIVWPTSLSNADIGLSRYATKLFRDPIWSTPAPPGMALASMFTGMASPVRKCELAETKEKVVAVPYAVHFQLESDRWFADIALPQPAAASYGPFVRLALARYQPESLEGLEISSTAITDFVPLMPDRTLIVERTSGSLTVLLEGIGPEAPRQNRVIAIVERQLLPIDPSVRSSDVTAASPNAAGLWHAVEDHAMSGGLNAPLSLPLPGDDGMLRLVVREIEDIAAPFDPGDDGSPAAMLRQRTVFLDVVAL